MNRSSQFVMTLSLLISYIRRIFSFLSAKKTHLFLILVPLLTVIHTLLIAQIHLSLKELIHIVPFPFVHTFLPLFLFNLNSVLLLTVSFFSFCSSSEAVRTFLCSLTASVLQPVPLNLCLNPLVGSRIDVACHPFEYQLSVSGESSLPPS